ncbi:uncharacterized protein A4U43_C09F3450 [Asparagus officinalis]|uniref:Uncharacterized protein n=1 Tax=Asparagus officinalis TaxID=4686 RepID=A0A5P1E9T6_ASPOF|nr:uncharacterized protein A4U43_C09F3450 [Asparagus officinalis]
MGPRIWVRKMIDAVLLIQCATLKDITRVLRFVMAVSKEKKKGSESQLEENVKEYISRGKTEVLQRAQEKVEEPFPSEDGEVLRSMRENQMVGISKVDLSNALILLPYIEERDHDGLESVKPEDQLNNALWNLSPCVSQDSQIVLSRATSKVAARNDLGDPLAHGIPSNNSAMSVGIQIKSTIERYKKARADSSQSNLVKEVNSKPVKFQIYNCKACYLLFHYNYNSGHTAIYRQEAARFCHQIQILQKTKRSASYSMSSYLWKLNTCRKEVEFQNDDMYLTAKVERSERRKKKTASKGCRRAKSSARELFALGDEAVEATLGEMEVAPGSSQLVELP